MGGVIEKHEPATSIYRAPRNIEPHEQALFAGDGEQIIDRRVADHCFAEQSIGLALLVAARRNPKDEVRSVTWAA
jgi:hypothetical protein